MRPVTAILATFALLAVTGAAGAVGSFRPAIELAPILDQVPTIRDYVSGTLELAESGSANRIGNDANPTLGGTRVGPYEIQAKPKGSDGPYVFELVFHTTCRFLDAAGAEVELPAAERIEERFDFLEIRLVISEGKGRR